MRSNDCHSLWKWECMSSNGRHTLGKLIEAFYILRPFYIKFIWGLFICWGLFPRNFFLRGLFLRSLFTPRSFFWRLACCVYTGRNNARIYKSASVTYCDFRKKAYFYSLLDFWEYPFLSWKFPEKLTNQRQEKENFDTFWLTSFYGYFPSAKWHLQNR